MSSVRPLHNLTHLRVVIHFRIRDSRLDWSDDDVGSPVARAKAHLRASCGPTFNFEGTAATLAAPLPCLRYIFVATNGRLLNWDKEAKLWKEYERWHLPHSWRVAGPKTSEPGLVELHNEVAETIIRKEELVLSEADTVSIDSVCHGPCERWLTMILQQSLLHLPSEY